MNEENKNTSLDILGIKPLGDTINIVTTKSLEGLESFFNIVCKPALEELGFLIKDNVRAWRLNNVLKIIEKAKGKLNFENGELNIKIHPRIAFTIIENGSMIDNEMVQEMWAGLFAASCSKTGLEDENVIFVDILKQLTFAEAKIVKYSNENSRKILLGNGLIQSEVLVVSTKLLIEISGITEIHRLDRELDHLRNLGLIGSGVSGRL